MKYNCIPIGDHCGGAFALINAKIRTCSYPFDWVSYYSSTTNPQITNIHYNIQLIKELMDTSDMRIIVDSYIGDALENKEKYNTKTNIVFPHESGTKKDIFDKYERRFIRLKNDIQTLPNLFLIISRYYSFEQTEFDTIVQYLLSYNPNNKILFICGFDHLYLYNNPYGSRVIFKHIPYDITQFYNYDVTHFRPNIDTFLKTFDFTINTSS